MNTEHSITTARADELWADLPEHQRRLIGFALEVKANETAMGVPEHNTEFGPMVALTNPLAVSLAIETLTQMVVQIGNQWSVDENSEEWAAHVEAARGLLNGAWSYLMSLALDVEDVHHTLHEKEAGD